MKRYSSLLLIAGCALIIWGCQTQTQPETDVQTDVHFASEMQNPGDEFGAYWYQGKAELSSYTLEQARYGEIHQGHAVLVYVTEDFSKSKQVKLDNSQAAGNDKVPIMKLNFTKKFLTGIYPYSMMQSVFTPVNLKKHPHSLKTSMSAQEWCGHTFTQFNLQKRGYAVKGFSYFESERDVEKELPLVLLEDEIWTKIRLSPDQLPTGKVPMIPGSFHLRLKHQSIQAENAVLSLEKEGVENVYSIQYPDNNRSLAIRFQANFPHKILGWEETIVSGWGQNAKTLTTKAKLNKTLISAYWKQHDNVDRKFRTELGLEVE